MKVKQELLLAAIYLGLGIICWTVASAWLVYEVTHHAFENPWVIGSLWFNGAMLLLESWRIHRRHGIG